MIAKGFADSASELMAEAKACAITVAKIMARAKQTAVVAVSLVVNVCMKFYYSSYNTRDHPVWLKAVAFNYDNLLCYIQLKVSKDRVVA